MRVLAILICYACIGAGTALANPPLLVATGAWPIAPLSDTLVLYADHDELNTVNLVSGEIEPWDLQWSEQDDGWDVCSAVYGLQTSPDGQWVCVALGVYADLKEPSDADYPPINSAIAVVLCKPDGTNAKVVALGFDAGGGPQYSFTMDSGRLVGQPFQACIPDAAHHEKYLNSGFEAQIPKFNYISLPSLKHGLEPDLDLSDGYWKCPVSDEFRVENYYWREHTFASFTDGSLGKWLIPMTDEECQPYAWVQPDAMLMRRNDHSGLLYTSGEYVPGPKAKWHCYALLDNGSCIFSNDDGGNVFHGIVNWQTFFVEEAVVLPDLGLLQAHGVIALPGSKAVLLYDGTANDLYYYKLTN